MTAEQINVLRGKALTDQIAAIVRDAGPVPIGTTEVGRALGRYRYRARHKRACRDCGATHLCEYDSPHVQHGYPNYVIYPTLRALARKGLVECLRIPREKGVNPQGQHYWHWTGPNAAEEEQ